MSIGAAREASPPQDGEAEDAVPRQALPAIFPRPEEIAAAGDAVGRSGFFLPGGLIDAWFIRRSDVLLVTFDNLSSIGEYTPPQPWLQARAAKAGVSILGLLASRKDWYRNPDTPRLIAALRDAGFFAQFRRVVFVGASMGGYAALTYARLVPGAVVLAFSPQTTLARRIVPFERRYRYAQRKWDWESPEFLDAAGALASVQAAVIVHDPFVAEDRAHARRLAAPHATHLRLGHLGHKAIRQVKALGLLQDLIEDVAQGRFDSALFARRFRARRGLPAWQRALLEAGEARGHRRLTQAAARRMLAADPDLRFARRTLRRLEGAVPEPVGDAPDQTLTITDPPPVAPFTGEILCLSRPILVPEREWDAPLASGVLHADGRWCDLSKAWIRARKSSSAPTLHPQDRPRDLPGTHLFAGHFRGHFGHFLVESTARLWALDHIRERLDSILYLPYRGAVGAVERAMAGHAAFFRLLGIDAPVRTFSGVLRVERLYVPELGFGWLECYAGSPAYRAFMQGRLSAAAPAEGGERLYISRARLNAQRGGVLGEAVIEHNLARLGYEIFHPEKHPLEVQLARYKAARSIVALDGSALHLAAYVFRPGGRVAMILRRSRANVADYDLQFRSFCGVRPDVIDAIRHDWVAGEAARVDFRSVGELDFAALFARLKALGHVPPDFRPDLPSAAEVRAMLEAFQDKRGQPFRILGTGESHGDDEDV